MHTFICFSIPRLSWMHLDLLFWLLYHEYTLTDPFLSLKKKISIHTQLHKDKRICVLWLCVTLSNLTLIKLTFGRNRCLRAPASFRAQFHCVQSRSVAPKVKRLCGCLNGIIWEAQKCPPTPQISYLQLQCIWSLLLRHYLHQTGIEMQICDITAVFCHYHINMDELARWTGVNGGWRDRTLQKCTLYFWCGEMGKF